MLFSGVTFLYYFLPVVMAAYFLLPMPRGSVGLRNFWLFLTSLLFYAWGEPRYVFLMVAQCVAAWALGLFIGKHRDKTAGKIAAVLSSLVTLSGLLFFKYADFFIGEAGRLGLNIKTLGVVMPIGISFYTFQILSYTLDVYTGKTAVQRNPLTFSTYVAMFPQLVAGPIVRYDDVAAALVSRKHTVDDFAAGITRFVAGLAKKVLLANTLGELADKTRGQHDALSAWLYIAAFTMQIYFDFSGYSDMAIGLGRVFGFTFPENFNYPYVAKSVTEFWRRWHMTLSGWFRDYVYIPLGGNRRGKGRQVVNILVVWLLTGFWHGAGWNFIGWGLYFGVLLLIEKFVLLRLFEKTPIFIRRLYLLAAVCVGWVFFDAATLTEAAGTLSRLCLFGAENGWTATSVYWLRSYLVVMVLGAIGATGLPKRLYEHIKTGKAFNVLQPVAVGALLIAVTGFLVDGSFNPFIYFRF